MVHGSWLRVKGSWLRVKGSWLRVKGSGLCGGGVRKTVIHIIYIVAYIKSTN